MAQRHSENTGVYIVVAIVPEDATSKLFKVICESPGGAQEKVIQHLKSENEMPVVKPDEELDDVDYYWEVHPGEEVRDIELIK